MDRKVFVKFSPVFYIMIAMMLLMLPLKWMLAAAIAATHHELCHLVAIRLCRGDIHSFSLSVDGANLDVSSLSPAKELICSLAGPIGGLSLLLFSRWIPRIAVCAAFQSLYNLLPIYPLDGGRALWCGITMLLPPKKAGKFCKCIEKVCLSAILLTAVYGSVHLKLGIASLFPAILIFTHTKFRKTPCKHRPQRLQ